MNSKSNRGPTPSGLYAKKMGACLLVAACLMAPATASSGAEPKEAGAEESVEPEERATAVQAYELRMAGKVDEAKVLLEGIISENPENAAAHYELARTLYHMALGRPRELENLMDRAQQSVERATQSGGGNATHHVFAGHIAFIRGYSHMMHGTGNEAAARAEFVKARGAYESALELEPGYREASLYLVELHASLPENMGSEKAVAERYAKQLEDIDPISGAKANSMLTELDPAFWEDLQKSHAGDADVLEELGKAYLREGQVDDAVACFEKAVDVDPEKAYLFLDLSIYHTFRAMRAGQGSELFQASVRAGDVAVSRYVESEPIPPMLAYALGVQSKYKQLGLGDAELGQQLLERAKSLDPYFSKATGSPNPDLFVPPGEISHTHRYLQRPF